MFRKVLIANRGAIACRIIRTLRRMGVRSVAVYSEADAASLHVLEADEAFMIGGASAQDSYLDPERVLAAARSSGAEAVHPGYGFLSENQAFAEACADQGLVFIGPTPANMAAFALKHSARALARANGVPLAPGAELLETEEAAASAARAVGYPVMLKATAGGGGIGMRVCEEEGQLRAAYQAVRRLAGDNFNDPGVFLERFLPDARHVEVQIFGDGRGRVLALGERDCSLQRRNQKVVEEAPAPGLSALQRSELHEAAVRLARAVDYRSAGTVEFLYDAARSAFYFLEVNTRLQVEHGVTEELFGVDLVEWMVRGAAGDFSFLDAHPRARAGSSIQARIYAEDPGENYRPSSGVLSRARFPAGRRVETWVREGVEVSSFYDPLLAKIIVSGETREKAVEALEAALADTEITGVETNLDLLKAALASPAFREGRVSTRLLSTLGAAPAAIRILRGGAETTVQDYPGRVGFWDVGVPPSGAMDTLAFRLGNRLLGNPESAAGMEFTAEGPSLRFTAPAWIALTGADFGACVGDRPVPRNRPVRMEEGEVLAMGRVRGRGMRGCLLVRGGLEAPSYLGSASTFSLGRFGGPSGRPLAAGDVLKLGPKAASPPPRPTGTDAPDLDPSLTGAASPQDAASRAWTLQVLPGPHGAPDFFTPEDLAMILGTDWEVHYNSNRTGVRLIGPKPRWARRDGGEAGLHPSNIHDNAYVVGAVDFTGDMPILLGPDGPSLGGFVCPFAVITADLWKLGQLAPADRVRFAPVGAEQALEMERRQRSALEAVRAARSPALPPVRPAGPAAPPGSPVLEVLEARSERPRVVYRQQGDRSLLVEYGPIVLDLELRARVHALMSELAERGLEGVRQLTPGIRSLQVMYDPDRLDRRALLRILTDAEERLGSLEDFETPSRIVHLPLSWRDPATLLTVEKYMQSVRSDAPWCPDNIEFIRRVNGLEDEEAVRRIVFDASYLVLGLGDVYLGAPVATPVDPRHRLVTTKYNPARTWTPPNVVGIGGSYMCIYGMEGPGGYQLFGRTIQVWDTYQRPSAFAPGTPWLLRFFDQIRFFPVEADELQAWRREFPAGRRTLKIEEARFSLREHRAFLARNRGSIQAFETRRNAAFDAERAAWEESGEFARVEALTKAPETLAPAGSVTAPEGSEIVEAPLGGNVWKVRVEVGARVAQGEVLVTIEAMKAECDVHSPVGGVVTALYAREDHPIAPGAPLLAVRPDP